MYDEFGQTTVTDAEFAKALSDLVENQDGAFTQYLADRADNDDITGSVVDSITETTIRTVLDATAPSGYRDQPIRSATGYGFTVTLVDGSRYHINVTEEEQR